MNISKDKIADLLQNRMNNCTNQQLWAVGTTFLFNSVFILSGEVEYNAWQKILLFIMNSLGNTLGLMFIFSRHKSYYNYRNNLVQLFNAQNIKSVFNEKKGPWKSNTLFGSFFLFNMDIIYLGIVCY